MNLNNIHSYKKKGLINKTILNNLQSNQPNDL